MVQSYLPGGTNVPSHVVTLVPPGDYNWTCASFLPTQVNKTGKSIGWAAFAQLMAECIRVHWRHLANIIELVLPLAHLSPQPKQQIDRFGSTVFAQLTAESTYTLQWATLSPKIAPSHGRSGPHLTRFLRPIQDHNLNGIWIISAVFAQMTVVSLYSTMGRTFPPLKIAPSHGRIWNPI